GSRARSEVGSSWRARFLLRIDRGWHCTLAIHVPPRRETDRNPGPGGSAKYVALPGPSACTIEGRAITPTEGQGPGRSAVTRRVTPSAPAGGAATTRCGAAGAVRRRGGRGRVRGAGAAARPPGVERVPLGAGPSSGRGGRLPGRLPRPGPQGRL